jgi:PKD repeat protein
MKKILLSLLISGTAFLATAQRQVAGIAQPNPSIVNRTCGTGELPLDYEAWMAQKIVQGNQNRTQTIYTIPVVVHVIHNGSAVGVSYNISDAQILSQIAVLNEDYRRLNADTASTPSVFLPVAVDCEINFCLAQRDPNGNATTGIDRINRNSLGWTAPPYLQSYIDGTMKPATIWDPTKYLNLWVVPDYTTASGIDLLGHATFPANSTLSGLTGNYGTATTDGVVVWYRGFGRTGTLDPLYNKGRTATHEIGHWLGLRHIWGDANCGNDFVSDTPTQQTANYGGAAAPYPCPGFPQVTCSNGPNGDMWMNYMDYCYDKCLNVFTAGQKARMVVAIQNGTFRSPLITSLGCQAPTISAPVAAFMANVTTIAPGGSVNFTDQSQNTPTSWSWSFAGGTPSTSTSQNPSNIVYSNAGTYSVTLTATNAQGNNSLTKTNYINVVAGGGGCDTISNFDASNDTATIYLNNTGGYISGQNSFGDVSKADKYSIASANTVVDGALIFFGVGKTSNTGQTASVKVWNAAGTGGLPGTALGTTTVTYNQITSDVTAQLPTYIDFVPNVSVPVGSAYVGVNFGYNTGDTLAIITSRNGNTIPGTAYEQFSAASGGGWYSYSDATNSWGINVAHAIFPILCNTTGVKEILTPGDALFVYPNPSATGVFTLVVPQNDIKESIVVKAYDLKGALIFNDIVKPSSNGTYELNLTKAGKGIYMLEVQTKNAIKNQKISIQ